ncbi:hypothetical protein G4Z16_07410 [Streptomyces bathyalis]|uniref:WXG100 family type VII secretion target n=1 Tax=Streptomyces bathyalis TaxID=2710756 RepID=A0A7T1WRK6_9ACTN|nr:hypothetical protein [Streptomyces bathyalis]QPP06252.1 hypothetical protein G4Z16_07410 [Streptomyces bathyalis]
MSSGYKVDLSALDEVIKKLNRVVDDMGGPHTCAKYETHLPHGWLGKDFREEEGFRGAHSSMKEAIEGYIKQLQGLITQFSSNASQVRRNYDDQEQKTKHGVTADSGDLK